MFPARSFKIPGFYGGLDDDGTQQLTALKEQRLTEDTTVIDGVSATCAVPYQAYNTGCSAFGPRLVRRLEAPEVEAMVEVERGGLVPPCNPWHGSASELTEPLEVMEPPDSSTTQLPYNHHTPTIPILIPTNLPRPCQPQTLVSEA
ncbi:hypothetical protein V501_05738 [Pseudogymnoascus sp. VKM F-4519 (FW-2642)]|nr:hypothetical protein V501_05738 [Pseudogymnoascus sp. VKM F-4519 (FW-2642)]